MKSICQSGTPVQYIIRAIKFKNNGDLSTRREIEYLQKVCPSMGTLSRVQNSIVNKLWIGKSCLQWLELPNHQILAFISWNLTRRAPETCLNQPESEQSTGFVENKHTDTNKNSQ